MAKVAFDTIIILHYGEPVEALYGKGDGLMRTLKKSSYWETMAEELEEEKAKYETLEDLETILQNKLSLYSYRIKVLVNQSYSSNNEK